ncbi:Ubiquitin carboxyl-terminal hydrolase 32 [Armadillidium nasatum]|uniref:Ubiquitin carboxyl-terminal hydrolase 32 n=1 Tax=Armadillidium nasatum TaxID=96803 RepID=A0A5N5TGT8_9CRUS|nr:Ubiquitin carboxyl-terminal hydrolase 32 [Armadillidium nasatum]
MGGKESKPISLTYEEALKRVTDAELSRIKDAFKRLGTLNGALSKQAFVREVLGDAVSSQLAELIFYACGGSPKGITFRDLFCSLVLLTRGNKEEKIRFIFGVYSNEAGSHVVRSEMLKQLQRSEVHYVKESVLKLFANNEKVSYDDFREWLINNPDATTITRWLLDENSTVSLSNELETPTFYQTLAGVTHLEESEILELEKRYWYLKGLSPSGRLDFETLLPMLCPPLSKILAKGVFNAFDENRDNHIDFKEMACGISAACRGPQTERQKFCFKIFDLDKDGKLREEELFLMCQSLLQLQAEEIDPSISDGSSISDEEVEKVVKEILMNHDPSEEGFVTQEEFLIWTLNDSLTSIFMDIIFQVCHIILGLKPSSPNEEGDIVLGWLRRAERKSMNVGQFWYIVNMDWWNSWLSYVSCVRDSFSLSLCSSSQNSLQSISGKKTRFQKANIEGCVAMDNSGVMVTSISSLSNGESSFTSPSSTSSGLDSDYGSGRPNSLQRHSSSTSLHKRTISSSSHSLTVFSCDSRGSSPSHSPCLTRKPNGPGLSSYVSRPSAIDNSPLIENPASKIPQLTSEGGRLKRNIPLVQGRDFVLIPDSLWKVLQQWYGGAPPLPRQVIHGRSHGEVELELYPIMLKILRHVQNQNKPNLDYSNNNWVGFGSYGAAISKIADSTQYYVTSLPPLSNAFPKRYLALLGCI